MLKSQIKLHNAVNRSYRNQSCASANNFFLPRVTGQDTNSFYYSAIKNWISLPATIKEIQNFKSFKDKVKENILCEARNTESCEFLFFK